jgi:hypothetical protein
MSYTSNTNLIKESYDKANATRTYDFLRPNAFRFSIKDLPGISFTCQSANLPALQLGFAVQPTPFVDIPIIGDKINFGDFTIRFIVAENMGNYLELYRWLIALGFPKDYNQFKNFAGNRTSSFPFSTTTSGETEILAYSDGTLTILDSTNNPKVNIIFKNMFPISLEALDFDISSQTLQYFTAIASFRYTVFEIESL